MQPKFLIVDLFCGAGGTTTGFEMTNGVAKVIACVNHDHKAIESHWLNHPEVIHYEEDIRTLPIGPLREVVDAARAKYPDAKLILWASLECTNFSKAKGGQPRDADSRTLAEHLPRYITGIEPDYIMIENVVEFMSWGPLDENGKPISRKNGIAWLAWCKNICGYGYRDEWKEMNSANYGAFTSRNRLFGVFAKGNLPIAWPAVTHSKKASGDLFEVLKPWKAVKEVLDFTDQGTSIFGRKTPLSEKTLERIYAGLIKFVAGGKTNFISKYYSGRPEHKNISTDGPAATIKCIDGQALVQPNFLVASNGGNPSAKTFSADGPCRVITTSDNKALVQPDFLLKYNSTDNKGNHYPPSVNEPCPTIATQNRLGMVHTSFLHAFYGNGDNNHSTNGPAPTLTTKDRCVLVHPIWIDEQYGFGKPRSIDDPAGVLTTTPKFNVVQAVPYLMGTNFDNKPTSIDAPAPTITANRKWTYIVNPSWGGNPSPTDQPCPVVVARQDKAPLYLVSTDTGHLAIEVYESDTECTKKIKQFMAMYGIIDIKMRMLKVSELLKIQGFPDKYKLAGNQSDQKKFIGNSVVPQVVQAWAIAMGNCFKPVSEAAAA